MKLDDHEAYARAMALGDRVWRLAQNWNRYARRTVGLHLVTAADAVAAHLSEGIGRRQERARSTARLLARGSLFETGTWVHKAHRRGLISRQHYDELSGDIDGLAAALDDVARSARRPDAGRFRARA